MEFLLDQYPRTLERIPELDRMKATVEGLSSNRPDLTATDVSNPFTSVRNSQAVLPINPWKVYAFASASHAATDIAFNDLQLDSVKYDTGSGWDTAAFQYTVKISGYYSLESRASCSMPAVNGAYQYFFVSIFTSSQGGAFAEVTRGHGQSVLQPNPGSFSVDLSSYVGSKLFLNAGDLVKFRAFPSSNGAPTMDGSAGGGTTYAMIHLLSG